MKNSSAKQGGWIITRASTHRDFLDAVSLRIRQLVSARPATRSRAWQNVPGVLRSRALFLIACTLLLAGCGGLDGKKYDGLMLHDDQGKTYILRHHYDDMYSIDEIVAGRVVRRGKDVE